MVTGSERSGAVAVAGLAAAHHFASLTDPLAIDGCGAQLGLARRHPLAGPQKIEMRMAQPREELLRRLNALPGLSLDAERVDGWQRLPLAALEGATLKGFLATYLAVSRR